MKRIAFVLGAVGLWAAFAAPPEPPNTLSAKEKSEGWILLFDGHTLNGWTPSSNSAEWKVEDGAIMMHSDKGGNLFTNDTFDNFELQIEFRTTPDVNSGIYLRYTPRPYNPATKGQPKPKGKSQGMPGYEINIRDSDVRPVHDSPGGFDTGSLVGVLKAEKVQIIPGQWNRFDITAQGDHFIVIYNGKKILDGDDAKFASGKIGLQWAHPELVTGKKIEFRNIKVRRLS
jgi:hypothetical protein